MTAASDQYRTAMSVRSEFSHSLGRTFEGDRGLSGTAQALEKLYNRWRRWSDKGIFAQSLAGLASGHGEKKAVMIEAR